MSSRQNGSMSFTAMSAVTILRATTLYLSTIMSNQNKELRSAKSVQAEGLVKENAMSSAGVFKSLISPKESADYLPAIMASNYFTQDWTLVRNNHIETPNSRLTNGRSVDVDLAVFDETPLDDVKKIMNGTSRLANLGTRTSKITLLKTNFDLKGKLALSADILVKSNSVSQGVVTEKTITARVPLPAPQPFAPRLEIRSKGDTAWTDIRSLPRAIPGIYEFRVVASGIVYDASVELDGLG